MIPIRNFTNWGLVPIYYFIQPFSAPFLFKFHSLRKHNQASSQYLSSQGSYSKQKVALMLFQFCNNTDVQKKIHYSKRLCSSHMHGFNIIFIIFLFFSKTLLNKLRHLNHAHRKSIFHLLKVWVGGAFALFWFFVIVPEGLFFPIPK